MEPIVQTCGLFRCTIPAPFVGDKTIRGGQQIGGGTDSWGTVRGTETSIPDIRLRNSAQEATI